MNTPTTSPPSPIYSSHDSGETREYVRSPGQPSSNPTSTDPSLGQTKRNQRPTSILSAPSDSQRLRIPSSVETYVMHPRPSSPQPSPRTASPQSSTYPSPTLPSPSSLHFHYEPQPQASPVIPTHTQLQSHRYVPSQPQQPPHTHAPSRRTSTINIMPPPNSAGILTPPPSAHSQPRSQLPPHPQNPQSQQLRHPQQPPQPPQSQSPQPQPPPPHIDPLVLASAEAALNPVRIHLETAWKVAITNVNQAMAKMNQDFTGLATNERRKNSHLKQIIQQFNESSKQHVKQVELLKKDYGELEDDNVTLSRKNADLKRKVDELEATKDALVKEITNLREENIGLRDGLQTASRIVTGYKSEFAKLHSDKVERQALLNIHRDKGDGEEFMDYMSTVLSAVTDQVSRQMESKMNSVLNEIQEQRISRIAAEQRSMQALKQLQQATRSSEGLPLVRRDSGLETTARRHDLPRTVTMSHVESPSPMNSSPQILSKEPPISISPVTSQASSSKSPPVVRRHSEPEAAANQLVRRISKHNLPRITAAPSPKSSSPQLLSNLPPIAISPMSSPSADTTPPLVQRKRFLPPDIHHSPPPTSESALTRQHRRVHSSPLVNDSLPFPARKRSRVEYDHHEMKIDIDHSPEPARPVPEDSTRIGPPPTKPIKEEGEILESQAVPEHEEGEVVTPRDPVRLERPKHALPPKLVQTHKHESKLGINHIDLLYSTETGSLVCRVCLTRGQETASASDRRCHVKASVQRFPSNASWSELIGHYQNEHPEACRDLEKLKPSQIAEMKQRMRAGASRLGR